MAGSSPVVGSSIKRILGRVSRALAISTRRRRPPDRLSTKSPPPILDPEGFQVFGDDAFPGHRTPSRRDGRGDADFRGRSASYRRPDFGTAPRFSGEWGWEIHGGCGPRWKLSILQRENGGDDLERVVLPLPLGPSTQNMPPSSRRKVMLPRTRLRPVGITNCFCFHRRQGCR
jgi:hypothetical protein